MAVITISRQVASLGDEIAAELAQRLGYHMVDREEANQLALDMDPEFAQQLRRRDEGGVPFWERMFFGQPKYQSLYAAVILDLASRGRAVIMGRGAQVVLRRVPQVLRVRVVAPRKVRVTRLAAKHGSGEAEAFEYIGQHDQARRSLVNQIFSHDLRNWALYHLVLNTETLGVESGVNILLAAEKEVEDSQPLGETADRLAQLALGKKVEARLRREVLNSIQLKVRGEAGGLVRLTGSVPSADDARRAGQLALAVDGVGQVVNELKTTRVSFRWPR